MTFAPAELESALARIETLEDVTARAAARAAVTAVLELHGEGLRRLCVQLRAMTSEADTLLEAAASDQAVASLLLLHGLHPLSLEARVRGALTNVLPWRDEAGSQSELVSVDGATVRVRVRGGPELRQAVSRAVVDAAPEIERVDIIAPDPILVPVERLRRKHDVAHEHCDLCSEPLVAQHEHVFDTVQRKLRCACTACALLLDGSTSKIRRVRREALALEDFRISPAQWAALQVPVGLAFFSYSSSLAQVIAAYPGPGGAIESVVPKLAWQDLLEDNPLLARLDADISALLVDRLSPKPTYHVMSIDECYRLTGMVRRHWQGITGGDGPLRAIGEFFDTLSKAAS